MTYHLLERDRDGGKRLADSLVAAMDKVGNCQLCRTLTESEVCAVCSSASREQGTLCVVESPTDMTAIEQGTDYRGLYFVLMGTLSPLDGIGPEELGLDRLAERFRAGGHAEPVDAQTQRRTTAVAHGSATRCSSGPRRTLRAPCTEG